MTTESEILEDGETTVIKLAKGDVALIYKGDGTIDQFCIPNLEKYPNKMAAVIYTAARVESDEEFLEDLLESMKSA